MPEQVHRIVGQMRTRRDEEVLDLIRETVAQLNTLGDRLEHFLKEEEEGDTTDAVRQDESTEPGSHL